MSPRVFAPRRWLLVVLAAVSLSAAARTTSQRQQAHPTKSLAGNVSWQRQDHSEHLEQTPRGVEQSWEFSAKPAGHDDLRVRVEASGLKYSSETAQGLHFADARGLGFGYGHGTWIDAMGVKTAVKAHYVNGAIELAVPSEVVGVTPKRHPACAAATCPTAQRQRGTGTETG